MKIKLFEIEADNMYKSSDSIFVMKRESVDGNWVLRKNGHFVDKSQYRDMT